MLVLTVVFGMMIVGCDDSYNGIEGTWGYDSYYVTFNNGNFVNYMNGHPYRKGTYTVNNGRITQNTTHWHGYYFIDRDSIYVDIKYNADDKWYTKDEFRPVYGSIPC